MKSIRTEKLPEDAKTCPDMKKRAKFYAVVTSFGVDYYIPVTKEMNRLFKIRYRGEKVWSELAGSDLRGFLQDLVRGVYFQVRDTVGGEVERTLSTQIKDNFERLFSGGLNHIVNKQLEDKGEKTQNHSTDS